VLFLRDHLKMVRVDAALDTTEVVKLQSLRYLPVDLSPREAVGSPAPMRGVLCELTVPLGVDIAVPQMAPWRVLNMLVE
jgi:hypothetical protein